MTDPVDVARLAAADQNFARLNAILDAAVPHVAAQLRIRTPLEMAGAITRANLKVYTQQQLARLLATAVVRLAQAPPPGGGEAT